MPASIAGISSGQISVDDFAKRMKVDSDLAYDTMEWWCDMGIGVRVGDAYRYEPGQRLEAGIILLQQGYPVSDVAVRLDWRDFEVLVGRILDSEGFTVQNNCVLTGPRMQIDVVGERMQIGIIVDCKHWRRGTPGHQILTKQRRRAQRWSDIYRIDTIPVVVTLYEHTLIRSAEGVLITPIARFRSFVNDIFGEYRTWALKPSG